MTLDSMGAASPRRRNIFISYSSANREAIRTIVEILEVAGFEVWWDVKIRVGWNYSNEIERRLNSADIVIVFWTRESRSSKWVISEATAAEAAGKLFPVRLDDTPLPLAFSLNQTLSIRLVDGQLSPPDRDLLLHSIETNTARGSKDTAPQTSTTMGRWTWLGKSDTVFASPYLTLTAFWLISPSILGHPLGASILLALSFFAVFSILERSLPTHSIDKIITWIVNPPTARPVYTPAAVLNVIDAFFGPDHWTEACFRRSVMLSLIVSLGCLIGFRSLVGPSVAITFPIAVNIAIFLFIVNIFGNFFSLLQSRAIAFLFRDQRDALMLCLLHTLLSICVFLVFVVVALMLYEFLSNGGPIDVLYARSVEALRDVFQEPLRGFDLADHQTNYARGRRVLLLVSFISSMFVCIAVWLMYFVGPVARAMVVGSARTVTFLGSWLDLSDRPLTVFGGIISLFIVLMGGVLAVFSAILP